jgi:hypothetical protein
MIDRPVHPAFSIVAKTWRQGHVWRPWLKLMQDQAL